MESKKNEEEEEKHGTGKLEFEASEIEYVSYGGEHHLPLVMSLVDQELSEPYSIFTYRYFVYLWPQLSFLVLGFVTQLFFFFPAEILLSLPVLSVFVWWFLGIPQR